MVTFSDLVEDTVRWHQDRPAVIDPNAGTTLTFRDLDHEILSYAIACENLGLTVGDHAGVYQRNSYRWIVSEAAFARLGIVTVPINTYLSASEVQYIIAHSEVKAVFHGNREVDTLLEAVADLANIPELVCVHTEAIDIPDPSLSISYLTGTDTEQPSWPQLSSNDPHRIRYSSATTGLPKGLLCSNQMMIGSITSALANQLSGLRAEDRLIVTTPLTHMSNGYFWSFFARGLSSVLMETYRPELFCEFVGRWNVTHAIMAPTLIVDLVEYLTANPLAAADLRASKLRAVWYGGSPMPIPLAARAEALLGPILNQQYGLTEITSGFPAHGITQLTSDWHSRKPGSCGRPITGCTIRILDSDGRSMPPNEDGEIAVKMQSSIAGYWNLLEDQESAFSDSWLRTGDIGRYDSDGFLYVLDRKSDMIISGGLNVYPAEVESVLASHPGVVQSAVVGVSHPRWLETPWAVVERRDGVEVTEAQLIDHVRTHLAHYKAPRRVLFVDRLPVSGTGKILRRSVRHQIRQLQEQE